MHKASRSKSKLYRLSLVGALLLSILIFYPNKPVALPAEGEPPVTIQTTTTTTLVAPYIVEMWEKVATCETGGRWWRNAPYYDGGLGISRRNWDYFAPDEFPDAPHLASKEQQVFVARKIQAWGGVPNYIPDQAGGCHAW